MCKLVIGQRVQLRGKEAHDIIPPKAQGTVLDDQSEPDQVLVNWDVALIEHDFFKPEIVRTGSHKVLYRNAWYIRRAHLKAI